MVSVNVQQEVFVQLFSRPASGLNPFSCNAKRTGFASKVGIKHEILSLPQM
jgi:hypothetical protein